MLSGQDHPFDADVDRVIPANLTRMRKWIAPIGAAVAGFLLTGCTGAPAPVQTVVVTAPAPTQQQPEPAKQTPQAEPEAEEPRDEPTNTEVATFVMPDLVGMNLQTAQDTLQSMGSYLMDQEDASGLDRMQLVDSNWKVCVQFPDPGTEWAVDDVVTLSSVKLDENC